MIFALFCPFPLSPFSAFLSPDLSVTSSLPFVVRFDLWPSVPHHTQMESVPQHKLTPTSMIPLLVSCGHDGLLSRCKIACVCTCRMAYIHIWLLAMKFFSFANYTRVDNPSLPAHAIRNHARYTTLHTGLVPGQPIGAPFRLKLNSAPILAQSTIYTLAPAS